MSLSCDPKKFSSLGFFFFQCPIRVWSKLMISSMHIATLMSAKNLAFRLSNVETPTLDFVLNCLLTNLLLDRIYFAQVPQETNVTTILFQKNTIVVFHYPFCNRHDYSSVYNTTFLRKLTDILLHFFVKYSGNNK